MHQHRHPNQRRRLPPTPAETAAQEAIDILNSPETWVAASKKVDRIATAYKMAQKWEEAEREGDLGKLAKLDFSVTPACFRCQKPCFDLAKREFKPLICGGCRAIVYCSKECQTTDWRKSTDPRGPSHKVLCERNKAQMTHQPFFRDALLPFPWSRTESDGSCPHFVILARHGLLGIEPSEFGYWSTSPSAGQQKGQESNDDSKEEAKKSRIEEIPDEGGQSTSVSAAKENEIKYMHGKAMLDDDWPNLDSLWKFKDSTHIPRLDFSSSGLAYPDPEKITSWQEYYQWRGLPKESMAALLLHYPLTVWWILEKLLKIVDPSRGKPEGREKRRQQLHLHYIGAEVELNFIPLFAELSLLLPYTDVTITLFGKESYDLVQHARRDYPRSIAARTHPGAHTSTDGEKTSSAKDLTPIFEYKSPLEELGKSTVKVQIYSAAEFWTRHVCMQDDLVPDAIIGLNAALLGDPAWGDVIMFSSLLEIPFAVTDCMEQILDATATILPTIRHETAKMIGPDNAQYAKMVDWSKVSEEDRKALEGKGVVVPEGVPYVPEEGNTSKTATSTLDIPNPDAYHNTNNGRFVHTITPNPFHRPGQRPISITRLPNMDNGFGMLVVSPEADFWERSEEIRQAMVAMRNAQEGSGTILGISKDRILAIILGLLTAVVGWYMVVRGG